MHAASGQGKILLGKQSLAQLQPETFDPPFSVTEQSNLAHLQDILAFAGRVGLKVGQAYQSFYASDPTWTVWVITASPVTAPVLVHWWFPIVGDVPYLGYFSLEKAYGRAVDLQNQGLETALRRSPAFSTLGWFDDPVYRAQLGGDAAVFAETILHELTHRTIYRSGDSAWNESIAEFSGRRLLELLAEEVAWLDAQEMERWRQINTDRQILDIMTGRVAASLRTLFSEQGSLAYRKQHGAMITSFAASMTAQNWTVFSGAKLAALDWSVPSLLGARLYASHQDQLWPVWRQLAGERRGSELARSWFLLLSQCLDQNQSPLCHSQNNASTSPN